MKANEEILGPATFAAMLAAGLLLMLLPVWLMVTVLRGIIEGVDWPHEVGLLLVGPVVWMLLIALFAMIVSWVLSIDTRPGEAPRQESEQQHSSGAGPREARIRANVELYHRPF